MEHHMIRAQSFTNFKAKSSSSYVFTATNNIKRFYQHKDIATLSKGIEIQLNLTNLLLDDNSFKSPNFIFKGIQSISLSNLGELIANSLEIDSCSMTCSCLDIKITNQLLPSSNTINELKTTKNLDLQFPNYYSCSISIGSASLVLDLGSQLQFPGENSLNISYILLCSSSNWLVSKYPSPTSAASCVFITVQDSINWEVGQQVLVTIGVYKDEMDNQNEVITISFQAKVLQFTKPFRYYHDGDQEYQAEVALLSRRIVFRGDGQEQTDSILWWSCIIKFEYDEDEWEDDYETFENQKLFKIINIVKKETKSNSYIIFQMEFSSKKTLNSSRL
ncbi:hypothetical protein ACTFIU_003121 [Dictyostelium citrinum]